MSEWMLWLESQFNTNPQFYRNLMLSLAILVGLWLLWRWVLHLETVRIADTRALYQWRKTTTYVFYFSIAIVLGFIWFGDITNLATYLGLVSAGLAIALSDPITNLAGWVFIFWRRPFEVGDRIQIGEHAGDVIDVRLFQFTLLEIGNWWTQTKALEE